MRLYCQKGLMDLEAVISGIKRMEIHDGEGIRTTVFFKGCPLKCLWCHNPEGIRYDRQIACFHDKCIGCGTCANVCPERAVTIKNAHPVIDRSKCSTCFTCAEKCPVGAMESFGECIGIEELEQRVLQDELFYRNSGGGVTFSGGECLTQAEFVTELARRLHARGISVDIDTCGYVKRDVFERILPYVDTFLYDIKAIDPEVHKHCTGRDNALILDNLCFLSDNGCRIEIRYPLIKGFNDGECRRIGELLCGLKGITGIKVLKYHHFAGTRYEALGMENTMPVTETTEDDMKTAISILKSFGLNVITDY